MTPGLEAQLSELDGEDVQIHLVNYVMGEENFCPPMILSILEETGGLDAQETIFCSDLRGLCEIVSLIYARIFDSVIWLESEGAFAYEADELYREILAIGCPSNADFTEIGLEHSDGETEWCIYYQVEDSYFVFEPLRGERLVISREGIARMDPPPESICYMFPYFEESLGLIQRNSPDHLNEPMKNLCVYCVIDCLTKLEGYKSDHSFQFNMFMLALEDSYLDKGEEDIHYKLICCSFLAYVTLEPKYYDEMYRMIYENEKTLTLYNKYYLWRQLRRYGLRKPELHERLGYSDRLYRQIYDGYKEACREYLKPVYRQERDKDFIIVLGIQFLSEMHAPTRTALERCVTLAGDMGKKVLFINTREQITDLGVMSIYAGEIGNVVPQYDDYTHFTYKGCTFEFYQCRVSMPELEETQKLLKLIRDRKPYLICAMGAGSIVADLAADIVPVINFPMAFSTIVDRKNQFSALGRKLSANEKEELRNQGYSLDNIIESTFTFDIKEQKEHFTRRDFGLPADKFLLLVVGLRLHAEVDDTFIQEMSLLYQDGVHIVFAGYFENYGDYCDKYPDFKEHSSYIGYQKDIMAVNELADLYVNPRRLGGGFSIAEAFAMGKPGITIDYGDVAAAAGKEFCVGSYGEMTDTIRRYRYDKEFYERMRLQAAKRVRELTDSGAALGHILREAEKRKAFF